MGTFIKILFFFLLLTGMCIAQWSWQSPLPQGNDLEGIYSFDQCTAIAVGATGTIIKTTNGGFSWDFKNSGTKEWLTDIFFIDEQTGWAAGNSGLILKSNDGGESWIIQNNTPIYSLNSIHFVNANVGFAVGSSGKILKTTDGGSVWSLSNFSSNTMQCVFFADENNGWICGSFGSILKTSDGGNNWTPVAVSAIDHFNSLCFTDLLNGVAVGTGYIFRTTDGGTSWTSVQHAPFNSVCMLSNGKGWAVGTGRAYGYTCDAGISWSCEAGNGAYRHLEAVSAADEYSVWMAGESGNIFKSTCGTINLFPVSTIMNDDMRSICFTDENKGWIVGGRANPFDVPTIYKTTNGGIHWIPIDLLVDNTLFGVDFINENTGWAVGSEGMIFKTNNAGDNWSLQQPSAEALYDVFFINDNTGWIAGDGGVILKTTDAGATWLNKNSGLPTSLSAVYFINDNTGWAAGLWGKIIKTTDGGESWEEQTSGFSFLLSDVFFIDENTGWIAGGSGRLLKTTDGGINWSAQQITSTTLYDFYSVYFFDQNNGCACGSYGILMKTTDGGITWIQEGPYTHNSLNAVYFAGINSIWAAGDEGAILKFGSTLNIGNELHNNLNLSITDFNTTEDIIVTNYPKDFLDSYKLIDVEVFLDTIFHTSDSDLIITLDHAEITDTLVYKRGMDGDNFINTRLLDASLNLLVSGTPPFTGDYKPDNPLKSFAGADPNGEWKLGIYDDAAGSTGTLQAWGIKLYFESITSIENEQNIPLTDYILYQNYPNPFNPYTIIKYKIPYGGNVVLKIFDLLGNEIAILVNEYKPAGNYSVEFNTSFLSSGVYFYMLESGSYVGIKKMILLK